MKTLSIIRHAKAEAREGYSSDFDRPLTERGRRDAQSLGTILRTIVPELGWVLCSPAIRARQTIEEAVKSFDYRGPVIWQARIYEASPETLLALLGEIPTTIDHAAIAGHNPELEMLIAGLVSGTPPHLNIDLATGAVAHIKLDIFQWDQIRWGCGQLRSLLVPKAFRK
jgi:phosphohistidine phosphatase